MSIYDSFINHQIPKRFYESQNRKQFKNLIILAFRLLKKFWAQIMLNINKINNNLILVSKQNNNFCISKKHWYKTDNIWDSCLKNSGRVFIIQRCSRLPSDVICLSVVVDNAGNDELESEARLVEAGVRWEMIQLDIHLNEEDKFKFKFICNL